MRVQPAGLVDDGHVEYVGRAERDEVSKYVLWAVLALSHGQVLDLRILLAVAVASFVPFAFPDWAQAACRRQDDRQPVLVRQLVGNREVFGRDFEQDGRLGDDGDQQLDVLCQSSWVAGLPF